MKKLYTLLAVAAISGSAFAQTNFTEKLHENVPSIAALQSEAIVDSLYGPLFCNPQGYTYTAQGLGYVTGTNAAGIQQYGTVSYASSPVKGAKLYTYIPNKEQVVNGNIHANLYAFDTTTLSVGALLGTSDAVAVSSIDTTLSSWTEFNFTNGPVLNGFFAMTVEVENGGDTISILSSQIGENCSGGYTVVQLSDNSFDFLTSAVSSSADMWLWMFLAVDDNVSTDEHMLDNSSVRAFPNPATDNINITYQLNGNAQTTIQVLDMSGRVVVSMTEAQTEGRQFVELNTSDLSAGTYFYSVRSGDASFNGKFVKQ